MTASNPF